MSNMTESVCKSLRSVGYPKKKEQLLEAHIRQVYRHEGPSGVVKQFKSLQSMRLDCIARKSSTIRDGHWIELTQSRKNPKRKSLRQLWSLTDRKFFSVTGAVINAVPGIVSSKGIDDWYSSAGQPALKGDLTNLYPRWKADPKFVRATRDVQETGASIWGKTFSLLREKAISLNAFNPNDITKTAIPLGTTVHRLKFTKKNGYMIQDIDDLINTYHDTLMTAPDCVQGLTNLVYSLTNEKSFRDIEYAISSERIASIGVDTRFGRIAPSLKPKGRSEKPDSDVVGSISFLPKPGGKLRVVANPNRYLQFLLNPLGEALQDAVYNDPAFKSHCFVMNQDDGRFYVQDQLIARAKGKAHTKIASVDLSSATDNMDRNGLYNLTGYYKYLFNSVEWFEDCDKYGFLHLDHCKTRDDKIDRCVSLGKALISAKRYVDIGASEMMYRMASECRPPEFFRYWKVERSCRETGTDIRAYRGHEGIGVRQVYFLDKLVTFTLGVESVRTFNNACTGNWQLDTSVATKTDYVSFDRGQPLGTRPSFPLLTFGNLTAGLIANKASRDSIGSPRPGELLGVVGDDIVLDEKALPYYRMIMEEGLGCSTNPDKTLVSSEVAEFVGYLHTRDNIFPKKPRVSSSSMDNALKFGLTSRTRWLEPLIKDALVSYVVKEDSLSDLPIGDSLRSRAGGHPVSKDNVKLAKEIEQFEEELTAPKEAFSKEYSGATLQRHIDYSRPADISLPEVHMPLDDVSDVTIDQRISRFNHHTMTEDLSTDTKYSRFKSLAHTGRVARRLQETGVGDLRTDLPVKVLYDTEGNVMFSTPNSDALFTFESGRHSLETTFVDNRLHLKDRRSGPMLKRNDAKVDGPDL